MCAKEFINRVYSLGKGTYGTETLDVGEELEKHLYQCVAEGETFVGEEVLGFGQNCLLPEAIWLLDTGNVIWVWIGKSSSSKSLRESVHDAMIFLYTHPAGRDRNTTISVIKQGTKNHESFVARRCTSFLYPSFRNGTFHVYRTLRQLELQFTKGLQIVRNVFHTPAR